VNINPIPVRLSRYGYVVVQSPRLRTEKCRAPVSDDGRLMVSAKWAIVCFMPAYRRARARWGGNAPAIASELMLELRPTSSLGAPKLAAEQELRRRIDLATSVLLNAEGIPTPYPPHPATPRPRPWPRRQTPWIRALTLGWA